MLGEVCCDTVAHRTPTPTLVDRRLATGDTVAIKKIREVFNNLTDAKRILREISLLSRLTHPNVVKILDILEPPKDMAEFRDLYVVFEYVESDLARVLNSQQPLLRDQLQYITMQLLAGMRHMHAAHVLHRDLKPQNVLVSRFCEIKVCDLGLARGIAELAGSGDGPLGAAFSPNPLHEDVPVAEEVCAFASPPGPDLGPDSRLRCASTQPTRSPLMLTRQLTKHVVTRWYRAPELILGGQYAHAIDIWSIGCIFAELLNMHVTNGHGTGTFVLFPGKSCYPMSPSGEDEDEDSPFDQLNVIFDVIGSPSTEEIDRVQDETARAYLRNLEKREGKRVNKLDEMFIAAPTSAVALLRSMLSFDPGKRITIKEAIEHPFFDLGDARKGNLYAPIDTDSAVNGEHTMLRLSAGCALVLAKASGSPLVLLVSGLLDLRGLK